MLGGLARRGGLIDKSSASGNPTLVVDSGRLLSDANMSAPTEQHLKKARLIGRIYRYMKVSAVNISEQDLMLGLPFLQQEASQGLPLISANLIDSSRNAPVFPPYVIKTVNNDRIAFFGLLSPDIDIALQKAVGKSIVIKDPIETAQRVMGALRDRADIVILLSDIGLENEKELLKKVPGIRFVLGGREAQFSTSPIKQGNTFIFQAYKKGMYAGRLQLTLTNRSAPFQEEGKAGENHFHWTLLPLNRSIPEDKTISGWIRDAALDKDSNLR